MRPGSSSGNSEVSSSSETSINFSEEEGSVDLFNRLVHYYLVQDHTLSLSTEFKQQFFLLLVSATGAPTYALPAADDAHGNRALIPQYIMGVCIPAAVVLYNATDIFFRKIRSQRIPEDLKDMLVNPQSRSQQIRAYIVIGIVSTLSAIPLTTTTITYPLVNSILFIIADGIIAQLDNTALHLLPVQLVLEDPLYRAPLIPFELLYQWIKDLRLSEQQLLQRAFEKHKKKNQRRLKELLIQRLHYIQQKIIQEDFSWDWWQRRYISHIPENIFNLTMSEDKTNFILDEEEGEEEENEYEYEGEKREALLELYNYKKFSFPDSSPKQTSWFSSWLRPINKLIRNTFYVLGAAWVTGSFMGYFANPIDTLEGYTHSYPIAAGLTAPAIYSFGVLLCFFGGNMLRDLYDYVTSWGEADTKIPLEVKLYPKTFILLMLFNIYLATFSFPASEELINDNFSGSFWSQLRPGFIAFARSGIPFLSVLAGRDFILAILRKMALHFGEDDTKMAAKLIEKFDQLMSAIWLLLDGDLLEEKLKHLKKNQLETFLGISETEFKQLIDHKGTFKAKIPRRYFPFLFRTVQEEEKKLITEKNALTI